jgi:hypothetical protein
MDRKHQLGNSRRRRNSLSLVLYDYILYDSTNERNFVECVDTSGEVAVYVKLPGG